MPAGGGKLPNSEFRSRIYHQIKKYEEPIPINDFVKLTEYYLYGDDQEIMDYTGYPEVQLDIARERAIELMASLLVAQASNPQATVDHLALN